MKVRVVRPALQDLAAGRKFYDRQCAGIGSYFFDSLFAEIDSLVLYAGTHRMVFGFYRLLAKRFPYAIYYQIDREEAIVFRLPQRSGVDSTHAQEKCLIHWLPKALWIRDPLDRSDLPFHPVWPNFRRR